MPVKAVFEGYVEGMGRVTSLRLIRIDRNRYSVPAEWANRVVSVRLMAGRVQHPAKTGDTGSLAGSLGRRRTSR